MDLTPFITSFIIITIAELGDKTQLAVISLCVDCDPKIVLLGTMMAFMFVGGIGVAFGTSLSSIFPTFWIRIISSILFLLTGIYTFLKREEKTNSLDYGKFSLFTSFSMVSLMEIGDKTQLATIALSSRFASPFLIFSGMMMGFLAVTSLSVILGSKLDELVPKKYMKKISSGIFIIFGLVLLLSTIIGKTIL